MPGKGFDQMIRSVAAKTTVAPPVAVDVPRVVIQPSATPRPDAPGSRDAPAGTGPSLSDAVARMSVPSSAVGADAPAIAPVTEAAPIVPSTEPSGELLVDDGEIALAAQRNADGTFKTKLDPTEKIDLVFKSEIDPTTGKPKVYSKTLPEIARMAKESITLQRTQGELTKKIATIEPEVTYYRENVQGWKANTESLQTQLDAQMALNRELLSAPDDAVIARREQYRAEMTPEKQLERLQAERTAERAEAAKTVEQQQREARKAQHEKVATSFMSSRIAPALTAAEQIVSPEAVTGKVTMLTHDLVVNGVIPPASWPEMEARLTSPTGPFQTWLKTESAKRTSESDTVRQAREAAEAEQRRAQAVVNETGRAIAPVGRVGTESAPAQPKATTVQGVIDRMVRRPLPDSLQRT